MKIITWNVNGLRACMNKGFMDYFKEIDADLFCVQETKMQQEQAEFKMEGYYEYWNSAVKKGYSGTAIFSKKEPLSVSYGIGGDKHNDEGRTITLELDDFYLVTVYTPNSKRELLRLDYRMEWEKDFRIYIGSLECKKPVVICGDLNVAHKEIDLKNPKTNTRNAGFTIEERDQFTELLAAGYVDAYRYLYPEQTEAYTWWSYMFQARAKNAGWRIDYFVVSEKMKDSIKDCIIHSNVLGSDHCPVELKIEMRE